MAKSRKRHPTVPSFPPTEEEGTVSLQPTFRQNLICASCVGLLVLMVYFILKPTPLLLNQWVQSPDLLSHLDIAEMNLECAKGLNGSEDLNSTEVLTKLDVWANQIKEETDKLLPRFRINPAEYNNSEAFFRMMVFATVLQQDYQIRYKEDPLFRFGADRALPNEFFFKNSADIFIHGLTSETRQGTCSSLPMLYVALGRRMGYPLKLVPAKEHLFVRWDDGKERVNIEATSKGFVSNTDEEYKKFPLPISEQEVRTGRYLENMTPVQELATCLMVRAFCLMANNQIEESKKATDLSCRLDPNNDDYQEVKEYLSQFTDETWKFRTKKTQRAEFPDNVLSKPKEPISNEKIALANSLTVEQKELQTSQLSKMISARKLKTDDIKRMNYNGKIDSKQAEYLIEVCSEQNKLVLDNKFKPFLDKIQKSELSVFDEGRLYEALSEKQLEQVDEIAIYNKISGDKVQKIFQRNKPKTTQP